MAIQARLHIVAAAWSHMVRLGTGSRFRIAPPDNKAGVSFLRLKWVQLSMAPSSSHGKNIQKMNLRTRDKSPAYQVAQKDKTDKAKRGRTPEDKESCQPSKKKQTRREMAAKRAMDPSSSRVSAAKQNSHADQNSVPEKHDLQVDKEEDSFANTSIGEVSTGYTPVMSGSPSRQTSFTSHVGETSMQEDSQVAGSATSLDGSRVSGFDALLEHSLTEQFEDEEDEYQNMHEATTPQHCSENPNVERAAAPDVEAAKVKIEIPSPVRETERTGGPVANTNDGVGTSNSNPPEQEAEPEMTVKELFPSKILTREPVTLKQPDLESQRYIICILRRLILGLSPQKADALRSFVTQVNIMLDGLASHGAKGETLREWESRCRQAEFLIQHLLKFRTIKDGLTSAGTLRIINQREKDIEMAQVELSKQESRIEHLLKKDTEMADIRQCDIELQEYWGKINELLIKRNHLEARYAGRTKLLICEQKKAETCTQAIKLAEEDLKLRRKDEHTITVEANAIKLVEEQLNKLKHRTTLHKNPDE